MVTSLPSEPLAAYAVGMLRKLARISLSAGQDDAAAAKAVDDTLRQAQQLLGDGDVPRVSRERFVDMLEDAVDWSHVQLLVDALAASREAFRPAEGEQEDATKLEESAPAVLEVLACAICCGDLMLKPATLPCGHSFCKACVELWLRSCPNCPTCRHPVAAPLSNQVAVNRVLQDLVATLYPKQTQQLEQRGQLDRLNRLHDLIQQCLDRADGGRLQDALTLERLRNGGSSQDQSVAVAMVLEQDAELRSRVMAAEIRERMRKERLLRESSRRRHVAAYAAVFASNSNLERCAVATATATAAGSGSSTRKVPPTKDSGKKTRLLDTLLGRK